MKKHSTEAEEHEAVIDFQKNVAKQIRHRLLDLDIKVGDLLYKADVSSGAWHSFQSGSKPAKIETMYKLLEAVGLAISVQPQQENQEDDKQVQS